MGDAAASKALSFDTDLNFSMEEMAAVLDDPREAIADAIILLGPKAPIEELCRLSGFSEQMVRDARNSPTFNKFLVRRVAEKSFDLVRMREKVQGKIYALLDWNAEHEDYIQSLFPGERLKLAKEYAHLVRYMAQTDEMIARRPVEDKGDAAKLKNPREALYEAMKSARARDFLMSRGAKDVTPQPAQEAVT